jgi:hypothetical protein
MQIHAIISGLARTAGMRAIYPAVHSLGAVSLATVATLLYRGSRQDVYNILWAVVFGFATLNILSLAARRMEPGKRGLTFGELMAVSVVLISMFLLGWEMLTMFHIFPIKIHR